MSQAIKLPIAIVAGVKTKKIDNLQLLKDIKDYAREVAMVVAILSEHFLNDMNDRNNVGYIANVEAIHGCAVKFISEFAYVEEWEAFIYSDKNKYGTEHVWCWEDYILEYGKENLFN